MSRRGTPASPTRTSTIATLEYCTGGLIRVTSALYQVDATVAYYGSFRGLE